MEDGSIGGRLNRHRKDELVIGHPRELVYFCFHSYKIRSLRAILHQRVQADRGCSGGSDQTDLLVWKVVQFCQRLVSIHGISLFLGFEISTIVCVPLNFATVHSNAASFMEMKSTRWVLYGTVTGLAFSDLIKVLPALKLRSNMSLMPTSCLSLKEKSVCRRAHESWYACHRAAMDMKVITLVKRGTRHMREIYYILRIRANHTLIVCQSLSCLS